MKRVLVFMLVNFAILIMLSITTSILFALIGANLESVFGEWAYLACFSLVLGFGGAMISLLLSKPIANGASGRRQSMALKVKPNAGLLLQLPSLRRWRI